MTTLYAVADEMDKQPSNYVQTPATVESLRAKLAELRRVLALSPEPNAAKLLNEALEMTRNHLAAMLSNDDAVMLDMYLRVLTDVNNGVLPRGVLAREDAEALFGL